MHLHRYRCLSGNGQESPGNAYIWSEQDYFMGNLLLVIDAHLHGEYG